VGKDIQLNFTATSDDAVSPELYGFACHAMLSPTRVKMRTYEVLIGDDIDMYNGASDPTPKATLISNLETLETQVYPIYVTDDLDEDSNTSSGRWKIIPDSLEKLPEHDAGGNEVWTITLQEVTVA
jgi:hypothetical protein